MQAKLKVAKQMGAPVKVEAVPTDADALRALEWLQRGSPEAEIVYDEDAPQQSPADLRQFKKASFVKLKR